MKKVMGLWVVLLTLLTGRAGGVEPSGGYCIGNQCFAVFQHPSDYKTAQNQCRDLKSHLMTVRSTDRQKIVFILLSRLKGRFWIGLHRTSSCPDAAAQLRGFQWVTGDSKSDFSNWATPFDSSCSSHRCVAVSEGGDLKWTQEPCEQRADGFVCERSFTEPCNNLEVADGERVTYRTPMGFESGDLLSLPPGSVALRTPSELKYICSSGRWLQAPWSCEIEEGGCEHQCAADPKHLPTCYCPPGQAVDPANNVKCNAAPGDPCLHLRCGHACHKSGDSYACVCDQGFKLAQDGRSCVDFNDCDDDRQCPGDNFVCVNTVGGFQCVCRDGYALSGGQCVDVDECVSAPCEHMCTNRPGGFECSCYDGHKTDPDSPDKCKIHCGEEECVAVCDPNVRSQCDCPDGYIAEERATETVCMDMDECGSFHCDQGCENTFGSYVCSCSPGYTLVNQYKCVKNDDYTDPEGSGASTSPSLLMTSTAPHPDPERPPSAVTVGALVGIIVATVFVIVLVVFLVHYIFNGRGKTENTEAL